MTKNTSNHPTKTGGYMMTTRGETKTHSFIKTTNPANPSLKTTVCKINCESDSEIIISSQKLRLLCEKELHKKILIQNHKDYIEINIHDLSLCLMIYSKYPVKLYVEPYYIDLYKKNKYQYLLGIGSSLISSIAYLGWQLLKV